VLAFHCNNHVNHAKRQKTSSGPCGYNRNNSQKNQQTEKVLCKFALLFHGEIIKKWDIHNHGQGKIVVVRKKPARTLEDFTAKKTKDTAFESVESKGKSDCPDHDPQLPMTVNEGDSENCN